MGRLGRETNELQVSTWYQFAQNPGNTQEPRLASDQISPVTKICRYVWRHVALDLSLVTQLGSAGSFPPNGPFSDLHASGVNLHPNSHHVNIDLFTANFGSQSR